jgi:hypothetical protein
MDFYEVVDQVVKLLQQRGRLTYRSLKVQFKLDDATCEALKDESLNLSLFVEGRSGLKTGQSLPSSLCWQWLGLMPPTRSARSVRRHAETESAAGTARSSQRLAGGFCCGLESSARTA